MSQPPPYSSNGPPINPDRRPLPPGWIEQWDARYVCCTVAIVAELLTARTNHHSYKTWYVAL